MASSELHSCLSHLFVFFLLCVRYFALTVTLGAHSHIVTHTSTIPHSFFLVTEKAVGIQCIAQIHIVKWKLIFTSSMVVCVSLNNEMNFARSLKSVLHALVLSMQSSL